MFSNPRNNIARFALAPGMIIADIGSGSGEYSIQAAKAVGHTGRVYAVDVQKDLLARLKKIATSENIRTIEVIAGDAEKVGGTGLREASIDGVILANILFQAEDKKGLLTEASRIIHPKGKAYVIDWKDSFGGLGPRQSDVVSSGAARALLEEGGFSVVSEFDAGDHHYGLIAEKK